MTTMTNYNNEPDAIRRAKQRHRKDFLVYGTAGAITGLLIFLLFIL
ncbi:MAG: hypothetical protein ACR2PT_23660 [Endozoicomonas sp.]